MRIQIATPAGQGKTLGNRITASRWAKLLRKQGHQVLVTGGYHSENVDVLVAIHARRSFESVKLFRETFPQRPIIVCVSGTDIHRDMKSDASLSVRKKAGLSLGWADRIVLLEPKAGELLGAKWQRKTSVILQSALPISNKPVPLKRSFEVTVAGHLRAEKDPFLVVDATQKLPPDSRIKVKHLGTALNPAMKKRARQASLENPFYQWLGGRSHVETQRRIARSRLLVLTSKMEGAPSVISESIVNGTPILATRITATEGLLGADYPGLFSVGNAMQLSKLLVRAESDHAFYVKLVACVRRLAPKFKPAVESQAWKKLLRGLKS